MAGARQFRPTKPTITQAVVAATPAPLSLPAGCTALLIQNKGPGDARIVWGAEGVVVAATDMPLLAGFSYLVGKRIDDVAASVMGDGGSATIHLTPGEGE